MKVIKSYSNFLLEKLNEKQDAALQKIVKYLEEKGNLTLYEYYEEFDVVKSGGVDLTGKLYFLGNNHFEHGDGRAVRFNFYKNTNNLNSVDLWKEFHFINGKEVHNKPSKTLEIKTNIFKHVVVNIFKYFAGILKFINTGIINEEVTTEETTEPKIETTEPKVGDIKVENPKPEKVTLKSLGFDDEILTHDIDVFDSMRMFTMQVASKVSNAVLIVGAGGLGKSYEVFQALEDMNADFISVKGDITSAGLYELLFNNRKKLIVFDDADAVWKDPESVNFLKAVLDTYSKRQVSSIKKVNYFNAIGLNDSEIEMKAKQTGKLPNQFNFEGQIIFISNLPASKFDSATVTRCLFVDVNLTREQVIERMKKIMAKLFPKVSMAIKEETLRFLDYFTSNYECMFPLNIRTLIHSINIRISNDYPITIEGKTFKAWEMLLKKFLLKPKI